VYATVLWFARHEPTLASICGSGVLGAMVALGVIGTWQFLKTGELDPLGFRDGIPKVYVWAGNRQRELR